MSPHMDFETLHTHLMRKLGATEEMPFGPSALVFKVMGKMFALIGVDDDPLRINLKCDPDFAQVLRQRYTGIIPGYHMSKRHWNTVVLDGSVPNDLIVDMIDDSYKLVVQGLRKADRLRLRGMSSPTDSTPGM